MERTFEKISFVEWKYSNRKRKEVILERG